MKGMNPNDMRRYIQKAMLSFICESSLYNIQDIAIVINEPLPLLESTLEGNVSLIGQSETDLIKLYTIALELYKEDQDGKNL